jgi:prophage endopeptidase
MGYGYFVGAILFVAALGGAYWRGGETREAIVRGEYAARDLQVSEEARIAERGIAARYRAQEQRWQEAFGKAGADYRRKLGENATALLAAESVRLRDPHATKQACGDSAPAATPGVVRDNGSAGAELSQKAAAFLRQLASEADAVVLQLQACQAVLISERK